MNEPASSPQGVQISDFLNPASMLTPGLAGAVTMMISNALWIAFGLNAAWSTLILSFLLGMIVWVATAKLVARCIYYVFNSLIIFSVAFGANSFNLTPNKSNDHTTATPKISLSLTTAAYAQTQNSTQPNTQTSAGTQTSQADVRAMVDKLVQNAAKSGAHDPVVVAQKNNLTKLLINNAKPTATVASPQTKASNNSRNFFHPWQF
jgi:uncharacterized membrane protein YjgN (DUF898 family)